MPTEHKPAAQRALRLASGTAMCVAASFGFGFPVPVFAPVFALLLIATLNKPLPLRAGIVLALVALGTTGLGLLLVPVLRYFPMSGVLLVAVCLYAVFGYGLRGGNALVTTFLVVGLTMISSAGIADFGAAATLVGALVKGLLLAVMALIVSHWLFPEPDPIRPPGPAQTSPAETVSALALRATLIVLPAFLAVMIDPAAYLPLMLKTVSLAQQSAASTARRAAGELLGSTALGGVLAILFWCALSLFVHLWMFFLWTLLFVLLTARRLYGLNSSRFSPGFWLNSLITMIILLGQSVQDSAAGKDVYTAFWVRIGLFFIVTLYACLMMELIGRHAARVSGIPTTPRGAR